MNRGERYLAKRSNRSRPHYGDECNESSKIALTSVRWDFAWGQLKHLGHKRLIHVRRTDENWWKSSPRESGWWTGDSYFLQPGYFMFVSQTKANRSYADPAWTGQKVQPPIETFEKSESNLMILCVGTSGRDDCVLEFIVLIWLNSYAVSLLTIEVKDDDDGYQHFMKKTSGPYWSSARTGKELSYEPVPDGWPTFSIP